MRFDKTLRAGIAVADRLTDSLQCMVFHSAWTGQDAYGNESFAAAVAYSAIVEQKMGQFQSSTGQMIQTKAKITFLAPLPPNGAAGRTEPVDTRDKILLPDGTTGPIVGVEGVLDPTTSRPYQVTVYLG